jgi:hypothetical protein
MRLRSAGPCVVIAAALLVAGLQYASPGADNDPEARDLDLLASAQPTTAQPAFDDVAVGDVATRARDVKADAAATTSADCDGCFGISAALQVVYASRARQARLDNSAVAWTQGCDGCTAAALSAQVVVLPSWSQALPNNRAMAVTAACTGCRAASVAFQVVVVADRGRRLSRASLADMRSWFDEQIDALRATVTGPLPEPTTGPDPTPSPTEPTGGTSTTPEPKQTLGHPYAGRRAQRVSTEALAELESLVTSGLDAQPVLADVHLAR